MINAELDENIQYPARDQIPADAELDENIQHPERDRVPVDAKLDETMPFPARDHIPADEYNTPGIFAMAFPTLFPSGLGDWTRRQEAGKYHTIPLADWGRHLMRYGDGRFAKHKTFSYFLFNYLRRQQAAANVKVWLKSNDNTRGVVDVGDLLEILHGNSNDLLKSCLSFQSTLRGTSSYWKAKHVELASLITYMQHKESPPLVFFTFSAADMHWYEMAKLLSIPDNINDYTRYSRIKSTPLLSTWLTDRRFQLFEQHILRTMFNIDEMWVRVEFQSRGSAHFHGLMSLKDAPDLMGMMQNGQHKDIIDWVDAHLKVTAWHPDVASLLPGYAGPISHENPLRYNMLNVWETASNEDLIQLYRHIINMVQRHKCRESYCIREGKCRFEYPKELLEETTIKNDSKGRPIIVFKRNDALINEHVLILLLIWLANMDFRPVISWNDISHYIAKYIAKAEKNSTTYNNILHQLLLEAMRNNSAVTTPFRKLLNKILIERDYSSNEVAWQLLQAELVRCSSTFVPVSLLRTRLIMREEEGPRLALAKNIVDIYARRGDYLHLSLYQYASQIDPVKGTPYPKPKVPRITPQLRCNTSDIIGFEKYSEQVLTLYKPWQRSATSLRTYDTWIESLRAWQGMPKFILRQIEHSNLNVANELTLTATPGAAQSGSDDSDDEGLPELVMLHRFLRNDEHGNFDINIAEDRLANDIVINPDDYDWTSYTRLNPNYVMFRQFMDNLREVVTPRAANHTPFDFDLLNEEQTRIIRICRMYHIRELPVNAPEQLLCIVSGTAGTGKSLIIHGLREVLGDALAVLAPTGIAAHNIGGQTIHSALRISPNKMSNLDTLENVDPAILASLQDTWKEIEFLIIDERSFIGQSMLGLIDYRLKQIFPTRNHKDFGGIHILLFGDDAQLPAVGDRKLSAPPGSSNTAVHGKRLYCKFTVAVHLHTIHRQTDIAFQNLLLRIRNGIPTEEDFHLLQQRVVTRFDANASYHNVPISDMMHLFTTRELVSKHNMAKLAKYSRQTGHPIIHLAAKHTGGQMAKTADDDTCGGLSSRLYLTKGCPIMLRHNICTSLGLVNGATGTLIDILYEVDGRPPQLPYCVLIRFPKYTGPSVVDNDRIIPIFPVRHSFHIGASEFSRTQLPICLAWAITVHK